MNSKKRADFTLDSILLEKFREYCKEHNVKMSNVVENLIETLIGNHKEEDHKKHLNQYTG